MNTSKEPQLEPGAHEGEAASFEPQFRVLVIGEARKAFRLEAAFWNALEVFAGRNGRALAGEVEARLAGSPPELNQSSALRASLARDLLDSLRAAEAKLARPQWNALVAAVPAPAFAVSARSKLLAINEPLLSHLQTMHRGRGLPIDTLGGALQLNVETPPSAIAEIAHDRSRRFVTCQVVFRAETQRLPCRARLIPVEGEDAAGRVFLGFLELGDN